MREVNLRDGSSKDLEICMITGPLPDSIVAADTVHISSLLQLLKPLAKNVFIISSNLPQNIGNDEKIHIRNINHRSVSRYISLRALMFGIMQFKMSYQLFKIHNKIEIVFLSIGAGVLVLPALLAKIMNKKIIYIYAGRGALKQVLLQK